jgi:AcrR family transcriptional regulator
MAIHITKKQVIMDSIKEVMLVKSLEKITVSDICDNCGIRRQMFYYYFKDKFDLVNSIYQAAADNIFESLVHTHPWNT